MTRRIYGRFHGGCSPARAKQLASKADVARAAATLCTEAEYGYRVDWAPT
jgi:hypothetical protein